MCSQHINSKCSGDADRPEDHSSSALTLVSARPIAIISLLLGLTYLYLELVFHWNLVELTSLPSPDLDKLDRIESFGRTLSGVGMGLALTGVLQLFLKVKRIIPYALLLLLTVIPSIPAMFYIQDHIVEGVIDHFGASERRDAVFSVLLKQSLAEDTVEIKQIPQLHKKDKAVQDTVLSLIGVLMFFDHDLIESVRKNQNQLVTYRVEELQRTEELRLWNTYKKSIQDPFRAIWKKYQQGTKAYLDATSNYQNRAVKLWAKVESEKEKRWLDYQSAIAKHNSSLKKKAPDVTKKLDYLFKRFYSCREEKCRSKWQKKYETQANKFLGEAPPLAFWTKEGEADWWARNCNAGICAVPITELLPWNLFRKDEQERWVKDESYIYDCLIELKRDNFEQKVGLPYGLDSRSTFLYHPKVTEKTRLFLQKKGVSLSKHWKGARDMLYFKAVKTYITKEAKSKWQETISKEVGPNREYIPPNLTLREFKKHPSIEAVMTEKFKKKGMGYISPELSRTQFFAKQVKPQIKLAKKKILKELNHPVSSYDEGQSRHDNGTQSLRSLVVPPIAIACSLIFFLIGSIKLPGQIIYALMPCAKTKYASIAFVIITTISIMYLPRVFQFFKSSCFSQEQKMFCNSIIANDQSIDLSPLFMAMKKKGYNSSASTLEWVIAVEPQILKWAEPVLAVE